MLCVTMAFGYGGGDGSESNPYQITNCSDFKSIENNLSSHFYLNNDIDCSGFNFTPWGGAGARKEFKGEINGNNFTIHNLDMDMGSDEAYLADYCSGCVIKNLVMKNISYSSNNRAAPLFESSQGHAKFINVHIKDAFIYGDSYVSGFVRHVYRTNIERCSFNGTLMTTHLASGLATEIEESTLNQTYTDGKIVCLECYYIAASVLEVSGLSEVIDHYSYMNFDLNSSVQYVSGLFMYFNVGNDINVENVYYVGEMVGNFSQEQCAIANWTQGTGGTVNIQNAYYDNEKGNATNCRPETIGYNTSQMKDSDNFPSFDFNNTWQIIEGVTYPYFQWETGEKYAPEVEFLYPTKNIRDSNGSIEINFTATHNLNESFDCNFYVNDSLNQTINVLNGSVNSIDMGFPVGISSYYVTCNVAGMTGYSSTRLYDYDNRTPFIQSDSPSLFNTTTFSSSPMPIQGNMTDRALNLVNITIFYPNGSIFWNDHQNLSNDTSTYSWSETFTLANDTDGIWNILIEGADNMQVTELEGLHTVSKSADFRVDVCEENFECVDYGPCTELNLKYCQEVNDTSGCDDNYTGDMAVFTEVCTYNDENNETSGGGGSGGAFPEPTTEPTIDNNTSTGPVPEKQGTPFSIANLEVTKINPYVLFVLVGIIIIVLYLYMGKSPKKRKGGKRKK